MNGDETTRDQTPAELAAKLAARSSLLEMLFASCRRPRATRPSQEIAVEAEDRQAERGQKQDDHGDDPRDTEPPPIFGEEIDVPTVCGPDATSWLVVELSLWMVFAWNLNNLAIAWGNAANAARPWYQFWVPARVDIKIQQYTCLYILARQMTYSPTTTFSSAADLCPNGCPDTVTICGGCIDRSEIGNFIYGVIARYFQMTWFQTLGGAIFGNRGRRTNSDAAAVELGWDFIDAGNTNANALCGFLTANPIEWAQMQEDGHGCPPCLASLVPAGAPHVTLPPIAGLTVASPLPVWLPPNVVGQP